MKFHTLSTFNKRSLPSCCHSSLQAKSSQISDRNWIFLSWIKVCKSGLSFCTWNLPLKKKKVWLQNKTITSPIFSFNPKSVNRIAYIFFSCSLLTLPLVPAEPKKLLVAVFKLRMLDHTHPDCLIISFPFSLLSCIHLFHDLCDKSNLCALPEFGTIGIIGHSWRFSGVVRWLQP